MADIASAHANIRREIRVKITLTTTDPITQQSRVESRECIYGSWSVRASSALRRSHGLAPNQVLPDEVSGARAFGGDSILVLWWLAGWVGNSEAESLDSLFDAYPTDGVIADAFDIEMEVDDLPAGDVRAAMVDPPIEATNAP